MFSNSMTEHEILKHYNTVVLLKGNVDLIVREIILTVILYSFYIAGFDKPLIFHFVLICIYVSL